MIDNEMKPGVFISHKVDDPATVAFLADLRPALAALNCEVWIDQDLSAGQDWRQGLSNWMARCSCSVLLISREALKSDWIFEEASVLSWRQKQDENFMLFPVELEGLTEGEIGESRLKVVLDIWRLQSPGRKGTGADKLRETGEAVKRQVLARQEKESEYTRTAQLIAGFLEKADVDALSDSAALLDVDLGSWGPEWDPRYIFALKLLTASPREMRDAVGKLKVLPAIKGNVGKTALPFWVDVNAAKTINRHALKGADRPLMLLNADYLETAGDYVARAKFSPYPSWVCHALSNVYGEDFEDEMWDDICTCILLSMGTDPSRMNRQVLRDRAEITLMAAAEDSLQFVAIHIRNLHKSGDWAIFEKLRQKPGGVIYLLLTGPKLPPEAEYAGTVAEPIKPEVTAEVEKFILGLRGLFNQH
jgi:hypothetical protein